MAKAKAQMEIMGLAIVVVLIVFGLMFYLVFAQNQRQANFQIDYATAQVALSTVNTMLGTTADDGVNYCDGQSIRDLYSNCARGSGGGQKCSQITDYTVADPEVCTYAEGLTRKILDDSIGKNGLNLDFHYSIKSSGGSIDYACDEEGNTKEAGIDNTIPCPGAKTSSGPVTFPALGAGVITVKLDICK